MSAADDAQRLNDSLSPSTSTASGPVSYVYPVRSLLSGIKPPVGQKTVAGTSGEFVFSGDHTHLYMRAFYIQMIRSRRHL